MSIAISSSTVSADPNQLSVAVARKALDQQAAQGEAAVRLIEQAAVTPPPPPSGRHRIDFYA